MPANVSPEYQKAEKEYLEAKTISEKLKGLQKMYSTLNKHKGNERLQKDIKQKISKLKTLLEKEKLASKGKGGGISVKKDGAAQIVILGKTNSGKSILLSKLTNAKPLIADYEFTTKLPEIGTMDYKGVTIQVVEIPAITEDFIEKEKGPAFLGIVRGSDLMLILAKGKKDEDFVKKELEAAGINKKFIIVKDQNVNSLKETIWNKLDLIYVYTKSPGKEKEYPPLALKKGSSVKDFARNIHKDFVRKFKFARIWGKSAKHDGMKVGLKHILESGDVVELHTK